jgi:signal transduction histidine kinase
MELETTPRRRRAVTIREPVTAIHHLTSRLWRYWFQSAGPVRTFSEVVILGGLTLLSLLLLSGDLTAHILNTSDKYLRAGAVLYCALRLRRPAGDWRQQVRDELVVGGVIILSITILLLGFTAFTAEYRLYWLYSNAATIFLIGIIAVAAHMLLFSGTRAVIRLWFFWERLRRQRLLWSFTHAHLVVVVLIALPVMLFLVYLGLRGEISDLTLPATSTLPLLLFRLFDRLLPFLAGWTLFTAAALVVILPPSALVSFIIARRATDRLENLATATASLRAGDLTARVHVTGEDEIAQLQTDFNAMAATLEQTMEALQSERDRVTRLLDAQRELVESVSHELRTPVATARGYLESLLSDRPEVLPSAVEQDLRIVEEEMRRLGTLIDDLFALSRARVGKLEFRLTPVSLAPLLQRCVDTTAPLAWQRGRVKIVAELQEELPFLLLDERRMEQVLYNLLHNAIRHTPPGGIIAVTARATARSARIEVRDTGEGIAPEHLPRLWDRFFRATGDDDGAIGGAGIGLSLVRELVEAMGGTVMVESKVGAGSCFIIQFSTGLAGRED